MNARRTLSPSLNFVSTLVPPAVYSFAVDAVIDNPVVPVVRFSMLEDSSSISVASKSISIVRPFVIGLPASGFIPIYILELAGMTSASPDHPLCEFQSKPVKVVEIVFPPSYTACVYVQVLAGVSLLERPLAESLSKSPSVSSTMFISLC